MGDVAADQELNGAAIRVLCENLHQKAREITVSAKNKDKKEAYQREINDIRTKLDRCGKLRNELV